MQTDLNNPNLFDFHDSGSYGYTDAPVGKSAFGSLSNEIKGDRDPVAQRTVGGEDRLPDDDGGHLIGARFNGEPGYINMDAQNSNLNRGLYKALENSWDKALDGQNKVFVNIVTEKSEGSDRPYAYRGHFIIEHPDGTREGKEFYFKNEKQT